MTSLSAASGAKAADKFVITLSTAKKGAITVQSVEFIASFARTRISLSQMNRLEEFFCPEVSAELTDILKPALANQGMLSLPDRAIRLPDVMLAGCRVMVRPSADGGRNIIIRFRKCFGAIFSVLHDDVPLKKNLADKAASQATEMLQKAFTPLFDLGGYIDDLLKDDDRTLDPHFEQTAADVAEKIRSLEMHKFFLMRYLEDLGRGAPPLEDFTPVSLRALSSHVGGRA